METPQVDGPCSAANGPSSSLNPTSSCTKVQCSKTFWRKPRNSVPKRDGDLVRSRGLVIIFDNREENAGRSGSIVSGPECEWLDLRSRPFWVLDWAVERATNVVNRPELPVRLRPYGGINFLRFPLEFCDDNLKSMAITWVAAILFITSCFSPIAFAQQSDFDLFDSPKDEPKPIPAPRSPPAPKPAVPNRSRREAPVIANATGTPTQGPAIDCSACLFPKPSISIRALHDSRNFGSTQNIVTFNLAGQFSLFMSNLLKSGPTSTSEWNLSEVSTAFYLFTPHWKNIGLVGLYTNTTGSNNATGKPGLFLRWFVNLRGMTAFVVPMIYGNDGSSSGRFHVLWSLGIERFQFSGSYSYVLSQPAFQTSRPALSFDVFRGVRLMILYDYNSLAAIPGGVQPGLEFVATF